jgi:Na+-transporting NADH:ubiquinone oxidoreductase subunit A
MTTHTIKKGFDVRLAGAAQARMDQAPEPLLVGVQPTEFPDLKAKTVVQEGDTVATGDVLFFDKKDPDTQFLSPATGKVTRIVLGKRRVVQLVEISPEPTERFADIATVTPDELGSLDRDELIVRIKRAGLWPLLRQRPVGKRCNAAHTPTAIYVNGMDTEPLAADPAVACMGLGPELQAGIDLLKALTSGVVYLTVQAGRTMPSEFLGLQGVAVHQFAGPHPAGLVGTHIHRIAPLKTGAVAWFLKAQEAALLGAWLRTGRYPAMRTVAVVGTGAPARQYFRVRQGSKLIHLTGGKPIEGDFRVINGTVLSGTATPADGYLGFYATTVTVLPDGGDQRDMFGWGLPGFGQHSASRSVFSWLAPKREYDMDTRLHGGRRPIVNIGAWESVMPLDIYPTYLVRAIKANDLEEAIGLGLLEVTEEDVALCTFVDPCKIEVGEIIRRGLDLYEAEG